MTDDATDNITFKNKLLSDIIKIRKEIKENEFVVVEYLLDMIMVELLELSNKNANKCS